MSEYEIAGALAQSVESKGLQAFVSLITTDERISSYHHPLSTGKNFKTSHARPMRTQMGLDLLGNPLCSLRSAAGWDTS
jgi:hypothetical protein